MTVRYDGGVGDVSAFVLAGGRSSRMGADKALLRLGEKTLLEIALRNASTVTDNPVIVGEGARYVAYGPVVEDRFPGCGPLGGIHAALSATVSEWNLVLSVDIPLMSASFLRWLVDTAGSCDELVCVPRLNGRNEPLCALYRRPLLPVVEKALRDRQYKVDRIFGEAKTRFVPEAEIRAAGYSEEIFRNVNTPEDYEWVQKHAWRLAAVRS